MTIRMSMLPLTITVTNRPVHTRMPKATMVTITNTRIGTSTATPIRTASPTRIRTATSIGMRTNMTCGNRNVNGPSGADATRVLSVERDLLAHNDAVAAQNRRDFQAAKTLDAQLGFKSRFGENHAACGDPEAYWRVDAKYPIAVIEGDQETTADAERIRATGAPAIQINTGKGCHLDADLVRTAMGRLGIPANGILFIENVGNLVCPAGFDLGEAHKVVIVSVTEGEDKPLKYSGMFAASALMVVTKIDLAPHLDIDIDRLIDNARRINPTIGVLRLSAKSGEGMDRWMHWLETARALRLATD